MSFLTGIDTQKTNMKFVFGSDFHFVKKETNLEELEGKLQFLRN